MLCKDCGQEFDKLYAPSKQQCRKCYKREWERNANKDPELHKKIRARAKRTYGNNKDTILQRNKAFREKEYFDSKRQELLIACNYTCSKCGQQYDEKNLTVHHKDRHGRGVKDPNNEDSNLIVECRKCHCNEHQEELIAARKAKYAGRWARNYDCCTMCGTTQTKHNSGGLCRNCYMRARNKNQKG